MKDNSLQKFVVLTGAESLLDRYIIEQLNRKNIPVKIFVRCLKYAQRFKTSTSSLVETKANQPKAFGGHLEGAHTIISTLSNPSGKNTIFDICQGYQNNMQLLVEAQQSGVQKFVCVADTKSHLHKNSKVLEEKNNFISRLKESGIEYIIVNHNDDYLNHILFTEKIA